MRVDDEAFRAMGCGCRILVVGGPADLAPWARERVAELEARWSRFRPDSELSRLNGSPGSLVLVSRDTFVLVARSIDAWRLTEGAFDPTVLPALRALGYDRSFESLAATDEPLSGSGHGAAAPGCGAIELFDDLAGVVLPAGVELDPGGLGKGLAADLVADEVMARGADGVAVDIGGDVRVSGVDPDGGGWRVALELPVETSWDEVELPHGGAVATSSTQRRRWRQGAAVHHHLVDPRTGRPHRGRLVAASVVAGPAWWAEALTKAVFAADPPRSWPALHGARAVVVDVDGVVHDSAPVEVAA